MIPLFRTRSVASLWPALLALAAGLWPLHAHAQAQGLQLRSSPRLQEKLSADESQRGAMHLDAQRMSARPDMDLQLDGKAIIRRPGMVIRADHIDYDQTQDQVHAQGHVRLNHQGNVFEGPRADLQLDSMQGALESPRYRLVTGGHGDAQQLEFIDADRIAVHQARYTTCRVTPGPEWLPEWLLKASRITMDMTEGSAQASDVQIGFLGLQSPRLPDIEFPLKFDRQSGLLSPIIGLDSISGMDVMVPYYWDIAPNRDATLTPHVMSKRGVSLETEFRYLESRYSGQVGLNWMPNDQLRQTSRWGLISQHNGTVDTGIEGVGNIGTGLSLARVSDGHYWQDFPRTYLGGTGAVGSSLALTQRILPSTGVVSWGRGAFSMVGLVQRWQTQQDVTSPITPPYDRAPQITARYGKWNDGGVDWSVVGDTTRFEANYNQIPNVSASTLANLRNGNRSYVTGQASRPWVAPWGFITPKVQVHATRYDLQNPVEGNTTFNRVLPTFSLDSGLVFERASSWFGRDLTQTLEPRALLVRTPYARQDMLPAYDTGLTDFNLSTIYSDNPYVGQDRIVDNDNLTLGVNSRFFDNVSGAELLRLGIAQRFRFSDQRVTLPGLTGDTAGMSDLLLGASTRWSPQLSTDAAVQINSQTHDVKRSTLQMRYNPGPYRLINAAYRLNREVSELVDVGWQWPLSDLRWNNRPDDSGVKAGGQGLGGDRWYSVGRMNYSLQDRRLVDTILGFEYDAGCWIGRVVFERLQSTVAAANTRLLFQLELVGFVRAGVGANPLQSLRQNIPRYQYLREDTGAPSRFLHYE